MLAYLFGSIPTGFLVGKARGLDIRQVGSGNIGATNVFRALGVPAGIFVLLVDGLKGFVAAAWLPVWISQGLAVPEADLEFLRISAGLAARAAAVSSSVTKTDFHIVPPKLDTSPSCELALRQHSSKYTTARPVVNIQRMHGQLSEQRDAPRPGGPGHAGR